MQYVTSYWNAGFPSPYLSYNGHNIISKMQLKYTKGFCLLWDMKMREGWKVRDDSQVPLTLPFSSSLFPFNWRVWINQIKWITEPSSNKIQAKKGSLTRTSVRVNLNFYTNTCIYCEFFTTGRNSALRITSNVVAIIKIQRKREDLE